MNSNSKEELKDFQNEASLRQYLSMKAKNHKRYKMYHSMETIEKIINNKTLYLTDGSRWNDVEDKSNFNSDEKIKNFGICLSYSYSENVAMWMLYGGVKNNGGMIDFYKSNINEILNIDEIEIGIFEEKIFTSINKITKNDFKIDIIDILYYGEGDDNENYYIKRSYEVVKNYPKKIIDNLGNCKKVLPWEYENETRIIISIDRMLIDENINACKISLSDKLINDISTRIYHAPNYNGSLKYNSSNLFGKIDWKLCDQSCLEKK